MSNRRAQSTMVALLVAAALLLAAAYFYVNPPITGSAVATPQQIDLDAYSGTWYSTHQIPASYTEGCECVAARYTPTSSGDVRVTNFCVDENNETSKVVGVADPVNEANSEFRIQFEGLLSPKGDYNILAVGEDYMWAIVGTRDRNNLWFLSRNTTLPDTQYGPLVSYAATLDYPVPELEPVANSNCGALTT